MREGGACLFAAKRVKKSHTPRFLDSQTGSSSKWGLTCHMSYHPGLEKKCPVGSGLPPSVRFVQSSGMSTQAPWSTPLRAKQRD
jgi:hypothetical protein